MLARRGHAGGASRWPPAKGKWCNYGSPSRLPLVPGDRFVVRANLPAQGQSGLATIGGGRILGVSNVRLRRKKPWTLNALAARRDALDDPARWCELMLRESALPLSVSDLQKTLSAAPRGIDGSA